MLLYKLLLLLSLISSAFTAALYNYDEPSSQLLKDDVSAVSLQIPIKFLNQDSQDLYLYLNGIVSFKKELTNSNVDLFQDYQNAIAVFYFQNDDGKLYYRDTKDDSVLLANLTATVREAFDDARDFRAQYAVVVTWIGTTNSKVREDQQNNFQLILMTDRISSYALMVYNRIDWAGTNKLFPIAGLFCTDGQRSEIPSSGTDAVTELPKLTNIGQDGKFLYRISGHSFEEPKSFLGDDSEEDEGLDDGPIDGENESAENEECPPDPYRDHCPEECEILTDERDCSMCICALPTPHQQPEPVGEERPPINSLPGQPATVEDDDHQTNDVNQNLEGHHPQPQRPTEQNRQTESVPTYNDLEVPQVPIMPEQPDEDVNLPPDMPPPKNIPDEIPDDLSMYPPGYPNRVPEPPEQPTMPPRSTHPYPRYEPQQPPADVYPPPSPTPRIPPRQEPRIGEGATYSRDNDLLSQIPQGIALSCAAANAKGPACDAHAHCIDYNPGYCCECNQDFYGNGEECLKKGENERIFGTFEGQINGMELKPKQIHIFADTVKGQAYFALSDVPENLGHSLLLADEIGTVIGWLFAKLDSPGAYNGFQLTGGIFNRTVNIHIGLRHAIMIQQRFTGRDSRNYFQVQMQVTGTLPRIDERAHIVYPPRDVEYKREGPGFIRSFMSYTIIVKELGLEQAIRVSVEQQIFYKECSFKHFDKEPVVVIKVTRPHAVYDEEEKNVRYASENKATNGFIDMGRRPYGRPGDRYKDRFPPVSQPSQQPGRVPPTRPSQYPKSHPLDQAELPDYPHKNVENPCAPGRHHCTLPHMGCVIKDKRAMCKCDDGYTAAVNSSISSLGWYCKDIDECTQVGHVCDSNADCYNTEGSYRCVCRAGFTGSGRTCHSNRSCRRNEDCHQWGECVPVNDRQSECRCRGFYVGDGVTHCGPPDSVTVAPPRQEVPSHTPRQGRHRCGNYLCHKDADCQTSYSGVQHCKCRDGFYGNGISCEPRDSLAGITPPGGRCTRHQSCVKDANCVRQNDGVYRCVCLPFAVPENGFCVMRTSATTLPPPPLPRITTPPPRATAPSPPRPVSCNVQNNCDRNAFCKRIGNSYRCICRRGYVGDGYNCMLRRTTPEPDLQCDRLKNCGENAFCDYDTSSRRYVCRCMTGFSGDGFKCIPLHPPTLPPTALPPVVNRCRDKSECHANAHCVFNPEYNSYVCECLNGFDGDGVRECRPVDECNPARSGVCHHNARCDFDGKSRAFKCKCKPGFKGDGMSCHEMQEEITDNQQPSAVTCDRDPSICHESAQCVYDHERHRYHCVCRTGWIGDGYSSCQMTQSQKCAQCSSHARCIMRRDGEYSCECLPGFQGNGQICEPHTSCLKDRSICDANAECTLKQNQYVCNCNYGYHGNGRTCTPDSDTHDMLLIARGMSIIERGMNADTLGKQLIVRPSQVIVGLAYDCVEKKIFWSNVRGSVNSAYLNGSHFKHLLKLTSPEGIVVDHASRNFYYVNAHHNSPEIGVASLDGKYHKVLAREGFNQPRYLALDLKNKHLYYSDWHRPHPIIGRMNLDGSEHEAFVDTDLNLPNGLVILQHRQELCWLDAGVHRLSCMGLRNRVRRTVYAPLEYPFGLTVHEEKQFYWTDWTDMRLHTVSIDGQNYKNFSITVGSSGKPYGIIAIPSSCTQEITYCSVDNGGCPYLCLPGVDGPKCVCPDNSEGLDGC